MALERARDRRHRYGRWWHAAYGVLHAMRKLPIVQMRQVELSTVLSLCS